MEAWFGFFQTVAGVAATLTGLLIVAISINLKAIMENAHLPMRATEGLSPVAMVLGLTLLALFPGLAPWGFGVEALVVSILMLAVTLVGRWQAWRTLRDVLPAAALWGELAIGLAQALPLLAGGALLIGGLQVGLPCIAAATVLALLASIFNAWVLLVEILR